VPEEVSADSEHALVLVDRDFLGALVLPLARSERAVPRAVKIR
jgi:hypothetical protein